MFVPSSSLISHRSSLMGSFSAASVVPETLGSSLSFPLSLSATEKRSRICIGEAISRRSVIRYDVVVKSAASIDADRSLSLISLLEEGEKGKVVAGARVRVKVPLKVYHVVRVPEVELIGVEGLIKDYVGFWKGKRISANLPYKVEFVKEIEGRGPVKFFAHLREDEFEYVE